MNSIRQTILATCIATLGFGCASQKPAAAPAKAATAPVTKTQIEAAMDAGTRIQTENGDEIVCRKEAKIGSRLAKETVCMTRAEWIKVAEESQRAVQRTMKPANIPQGK
jgi:hypothetical protein